MDPCNRSLVGTRYGLVPVTEPAAHGWPTSPLDFRLYHWRRDRMICSVWGTLQEIREPDGPGMEVKVSDAKADDVNNDYGPRRQGSPRRGDKTQW